MVVVVLVRNENDLSSSGLPFVKFEMIAAKLHLLVLELALDFPTVRKAEFIVATRQFSYVQLHKEASLILGETREDPPGSAGGSYYEKTEEDH
jgi:hypothetical protein